MNFFQVDSRVRMWRFSDVSELTQSPSSGKMGIELVLKRRKPSHLDAAVCPRKPHWILSPKNLQNFQFKSSHFKINIWKLKLVLTLLTWRTEWAPNSASGWQMGFNAVFKGLIVIGKSVYTSQRACVLFTMSRRLMLYRKWGFFYADWGFSILLLQL